MDNHNNSIDSGEDKQIPFNYNSTYHMMTNSYFCFECGAIMTTTEDKIQHEVLESSKKTGEMEDKH